MATHVCIVPQYKTWCYTCQRLAANVGTLAAILAQLATHPASDVRYWPAVNTSTPYAVLLRPTKDEDGIIRHASYSTLNLRAARALALQEGDDL